MRIMKIKCTERPTPWTRGVFLGAAFCVTRHPLMYDGGQLIIWRRRQFKLMTTFVRGATEFQICARAACTLCLPLRNLVSVRAHAPPPVPQINCENDQCLSQFMLRAVWRLRARPPPVTHHPLAGPAASFGAELLSWEKFRRSFAACWTEIPRRLRPQ